MKEMIFENLIYLLKNKGFTDTMFILSRSDDKINIHTFYRELCEFSYYNSYYRLKDELIRQGLIELQKIDKDKYIKLTKKGKELLKKLTEINILINN
jgi:predicted transcriptional regulator